jgi:hypothetical protein
MRWQIFLALAVFVAGCTSSQNPPNRYAWVTGLNPEKAAHYKELHAHPWPGVNKMMALRGFKWVVGLG